jgi:8-oxo-dGTP diphosphatase
MATSIAPIAPVDPPVIKAAGGILQRSAPRGDEVMVVYRKHHQDWTLPRGKVKDGESFQEAAMREVEDETGCSCRIGNYLGTISYSDNGVPKVVLFWKMTLVEEKGSRNNEQIGEALWLQVPAAIERLTHAQEKALLSRVGSIPKQSETPVATAVSAQSPVAAAANQALAAGPQTGRSLSLETHRAHSRLLRECEAFRVELGFLERRSQRHDNFWAIAAHEQRYTVFGMNQIELANRAHVLREESLKMNSWRAAAMEGLLSGPEDQLTAENIADAIALRNEDFSHQHFKTQIVGDRLRVLLVICGLSAIAAAPCIFLPGRTPIVSAVLFFGLLGSAVCSAQSLIGGRSEAAASNLFITLTPVLFGALAGLCGYAIYEYMPSLTFHSGDRHISAVMGLAFLFGCMGQRLLAHIADGRRRKPAHA